MFNLRDPPAREPVAEDSSLSRARGLGSDQATQAQLFAGAKVTMTMSQAGDEAGDTLAVLNN
eukprot:6271177-Lingulodinium_polyedra.AAC.1